MGQTMKKRCWNMLLALMLGIGIMGAVNVQAQEKVKVYVEPYTSEPINGPYTGIFEGSVDEICVQFMAADNEYRSNATGYNAVYSGNGRINSSIPGMSGHWTGGMKKGWLNCPFDAVRKKDQVVMFSSGMGLGVECKAGMMYEYDWTGCYEERVKCEGGAINPQTGLCEAAKECPADLVKDQNGNCTCPEGEELVRLWGDNRCEPKCPENKERDVNGDCVCSFGFVEDENGDCGCPEGFEPVQQSGARSTGAQQCERKCDEGYVRRNGVCVALPYEPHVNPAVCGKTPIQIDDGRGRLPDLGAVACDGAERDVCFWPESHIDQDTKIANWDDLDLVAQGIIQDCVIEHETVHYNDTGYCNVYKRWGRLAVNERLDSERRAFEAERVCYMREIDRCGTNEACINDIGKEMAVVEDNLACIKDPSACKE